MREFFSLYLNKIQYIIIYYGVHLFQINMLKKYGADSGLQVAWF